MVAPASLALLKLCAKNLELSEGKTLDKAIEALSNNLLR
jgi:hypothetical protein